MGDAKHPKRSVGTDLNITKIDDNEEGKLNASRKKKLSEKSLLNFEPNDQIKEVLLTEGERTDNGDLDYSIIKLSRNGIKPIVRGPKYRDFIKDLIPRESNFKKAKKKIIHEDLSSSVRTENNPIRNKKPKNTQDYSKAYDLIILITAYNEGKNEFEKTIQQGIDANIPDLYHSGCRNIAVIVIVDGLAPFYKASKVHKKPEENKKVCPCCFTSEKDVCLNKHCKKKLNERGCMAENYFDQYVDWNRIKSKLRLLYGLHQNSDKLDEESDPITLRENKTIIKKADVFNETEIEKAHLFCKIAEVTENDPETGTKRTYEYKFMFCIKQENKKKLNTHTWFLKGFCPRMKPKFVIFLDVGTKPLKKSLSPLYNCLKQNKRIAGCCGEIIPDSLNCSNFVEQAQIVEYKFSHIFDKSLESLFGYISVLPGAFSAYRYECFTEEILDVYFYTENNSNISLFEANMYLAEDRILCLEMICMKDKNYLLRYIPGSQAETDVPDQLWLLMMQRRRWNNGAWFSSIYTIRNWSKINQSSHSCCRKTALCLFMFYYVISTLFSWVLVGLFYVSFSISLKRNLGETNNDLNRLNKFSTPVIMLYVSTLIALVVVSLSAKPEKIKHFLNFLSFTYGIFTILTLILALRFVFRDSVDVTNVSGNISILILGIIILMSFLIIVLKYCKAICPILKGIFQFFFLSGTYVNIFLTYSICNIHDVSWGNRPGGESTSETQKAKFESQRVIWLIIWVLCNGLFAYFFNWVSGGHDESAREFIIYFAWITFGVIFIKMLGGLFYVFYTWCCLRIRSHINTKEQSEDRA